MTNDKQGSHDKVVGSSESLGINDAALFMARQALKQAERRDLDCAFWFISALSKLCGTDKNMTVENVLAFAEESMPKAVQEWNRYVKNT